MALTVNNIVVAVTATAASAVAAMSFISLSTPNLYCDAFTTTTPITIATTSPRDQPSSLPWKLCSSSLQAQQVAGTSTSKQKNKKGGKKNKKKGSKNAGGVQPVSLEELAEQVQSKYLYGKSGPLKDKVRKRGLENKKDDGEATASSSSTTTTSNATTGGKPSSATNDKNTGKSSKKTRANLDATSDSSSYTGLWDQEQEDFLKMLNGRPALVLNADYMPLNYLPLSLWSWQDAVKNVFMGKVVVVDVYPDITVRASNIEVPLPSIIALTDYVPQKNHKPAFTRRNVFLRDEYRCQYCGNHFHTADLSLDHVVPRSKGGVLSWENAVTSCTKCNGRKGSVPVSELKSIGMKLLREPRCPSQMELAARAARMVPKRVHPTWKPYLGIAERPPPSTPREGDEDFIDDRYFEEEV